MLYGLNNKMVVRITVRTVKEEVSNVTRSFDVVSWIHTRLLQWVGHILRIESSDNEPRMHETQNGKMHTTRILRGDLLMDIPRHCDSLDLVKKTQTQSRLIETCV